MLIYNVTTKVTHSIHTKWLEWMKEKHIPEVMASGCFISQRLVRLLDTDESDGVTYAAQYEVDNKELYDIYIEQHAPALRKDMMNTFGDQFISFRSLMEVVN